MIWCDEVKKYFLQVKQLWCRVGVILDFNYVFSDLVVPKQIQI